MQIQVLTNEITNRGLYRMVSFHEKSVNSRKLNNSYKLGAEKVAKTISGRDHFVSRSIKCLDLISLKEFNFNSIKEAEEYFDNIGIHITRATISQGLLRTNGSYTYKNKFKFSY